MAENLTRKLLAAHRRDGALDPGADLTVAVDQILIEDATGSMCCMQFEALDVDRVAVELAVLYVDHNVLQIDERNMAEHHYLRAFCRRYGVRYSAPGNGISHYVHLERFDRPGALLVGADSHSTMAGAVGMIALGAGGLDVAVAMAGYGYQLGAPRVVGVELTGRLPDWVEAKDVILELLRRHGVRGGTGRGLRVHRRRRRHAVGHRAGDDLQHDHRDGGDGRDLPERRAGARVADRAAARGRVDRVHADDGADYDEHETIDMPRWSH